MKQTAEGKRKIGMIVFLILMGALFVGICHQAYAYEIDTGNENITFRWDNTLRYNLAYRVNDQNEAILKNPNNDDGNRNFDKGIVSNRLDLFSEIDLVYKRYYGIRISGAAWYDQRYHDGLDNDSLATANNTENKSPSLDLNNYVDSYYAGPDCELLDAFVFGKFHLSSIPVNVKIGRHSVMWGESLLLGGYLHSVAYAQAPLDLAKGQAQPGVEAKELFRPLNNVSFNAQLTETVSIAGQGFLEWDRNLVPEGGSYLGGNDFLLGGGNSYIAGVHPLLGTIRFPHGSDIEPEKVKDWGISARWCPNWLDGTIGIYYRDFSDKIPQLFVTPTGPTTGTWQAAYGSDIRLYGISLSKQVRGISISSEFSYRENMPLVSDPVIIAAGEPIPATGEVPGAVGNTYHGVINFIGSVSRTMLFDTANWNMEFAWNRWDNVTKGSQYFKGREGYNKLDSVSKDYIGVSATFTPKWYQVFPGIDVTAPLSFSTGLKGNSAVSGGGNKNAGSLSAGIGADIFNKYKIDLKYIDYFGEFDTDPATGALAVANGAAALLKDRGMVTLTIKMTF